MTERYSSADEFLAAHSEFVEDVKILEASGFIVEETPEPPKKPTKDWSETQRARTEYLKEWEEDMRYAQELANEGM